LVLVPCNLNFTWRSSKIFISLKKYSLYKDVSKVKLSCYCLAGVKRERKYISYSILTSALDGCPGPALRSGKGLPTPIGYETGWTSELVWSQRLEEIFFASAGDQTPVIQSVVTHYTEWATPAPTKILYLT
jgi:hypothetical protein